MQCCQVKGCKVQTRLPAGLHTRNGELTLLALVPILILIVTHGYVQLKPAETASHIVGSLLFHQSISVLILGLRKLRRENQGIETALVDEDGSLSSTRGDHFVHPFIFIVNMVKQSLTSVAVP